MFEFDEIHPHIHVYKGLINDPRYCLNVLQNSSMRNEKDSYFGEWEEWFMFGKYTNMERYKALLNKTVDEPMIEDIRTYEEIMNVTRAAMGHYAGFYKIDLPESSFYSEPSFAYYYENVSVGNWDNGMTMNYHTDFVLPEWYWPGDKFLVTCTIYLNDDYDGGEIEFLVNDEIVPYKPKAGDVVVFPSGSPLFPGGIPYYHGVRDITKGRKYLIRAYIKYIAKETDKWLDGQKKYGKDEWPVIAKKIAKEYTSVSVDHETGTISYPDWNFLYNN